MRGNQELCRVEFIKLRQKLNYPFNGVRINHTNVFTQEAKGFDNKTTDACRGKKHKAKQY
ncbi:unnamed protein product, partial [marine sediment metagenome]